MIEYIIIEKDKNKINKYKEIINNIMLNYDYEYEINNNYYSKENAIYLITDIEQVKKIRFELQDWNSIVILITNKKIEENNYLILDKINELDINIRLKVTIDLALTILNKDKRNISYTYKGIIYNINIDKILYIEKVKESKNILIVTEEKEYICPLSLDKIRTKLPLSFKKCSRSYIISIKQVKEFNIKDNIITFYNDKEIKELSREYKKDIINYLRNI